MDDATVANWSRVRAWAPDVFRFTIVGLLLGPGVSKFLTYDHSVQFFDSLGLPAPGVLVIAVGVAELLAAVLLVVDRAPRAAVLLTIPIMVVAAVTAGPSWQNVGALVAALGVLAVETSATDPSEVA